MNVHRRALCELADELGDDVTWAVTASANLALRGVSVAPGDVDVMTDASGAYSLEDAFSDRIVREVSFSASRSKRIASHFGILAFGDVDVEVMGEVRHLVDGRWSDPIDVADEREFLAVSGRDIPAMPLAHELRGYRELGRERRVRQIGSFLAE